MPKQFFAIFCRLVSVALKNFVLSLDFLNYCCSTTQQRRKLLKDTWYFECHCTRCDDPDDAYLSSILCPNCPVN